LSSIESPRQPFQASRWGSIRRGQLATSSAPSLLVPSFDAPRSPTRNATPSAEFEEDFVDGLSLGNSAVDDFVVHVIVDDDALRGAVFFVGAEDTKRCPPSEKAEDMSGNLQHVSIHATRPRLPTAT
jgi:hypothetical protein